MPPRPKATPPLPEPLPWIRPDLRSLARPISALRADPQNARKHGGKNLAALAGSLKAHGQVKPLVVREGVVIAGNGTLAVARDLGWTHLACVEFAGSDAEARAYGIADNRTAELAEWDDAALAEALRELDGAGFLDAAGYDAEALADALAAADATIPPDEKEGEKDFGCLARSFGAPPFSTLDARQGYWKERKAQWLALGIKSGEGRAPTGAGCHVGANSAFAKGRAPTGFAVGATATGGASDVVSVFDPVLAELANAWFCPPGGAVLDPFAGGSVRGIVTERLGRRYTGIDLSAKQLEENREQAQRLFPERGPMWIAGDSSRLGDLLPPDYKADLVFSCPPYADLEVYSDDPRDISTMPYPAFREAHAAIVAQAVARLREDRFAVWVVGEVRDKAGRYVGFVPDCVRAFESAGARFYNEAIFLQPLASAAVRAAIQFRASRKLCKVHQNVLVFVKGDPVKAAKACGDVEVMELDPDAEAGAPE